MISSCDHKFSPMRGGGQPEAVTQQRGLFPTCCLALIFLLVMLKSQLSGTETSVFD